ncbi:MAG: hypothetical protein RL069_956 [Planctomycetota bacterium]
MNAFELGLLTMKSLTKTELRAVRAICELNYTNPFTAKRLELEQVALGGEFETEEIGFWSHIDPRNPTKRKNLVRVVAKSKILLTKLRGGILGGEQLDPEHFQLYADLAYFVLFDELLGYWEYPRELHTDRVNTSTQRATAETWKRYSEQFDYWLKIPGFSYVSDREKCHLFAIFHQVYRAFFAIFNCVVGKSKPAAELRSRIWESIFTVNMRRYRDCLYQHLSQVTTLVTGPSGSGKELVSRAIGLSGYIPFDRASVEFRSDFVSSYRAVNIAAFSSSLVESELFGHAKGAFTGAVSSRAGWLEVCGKDGSILLDEIGELEMPTQVKLLRVLQNREFQRSGESNTRKFEGKLIAATNRDLKEEIAKHHFREDLYYRLCADVIETPSLHAQVKDNPDVFENLVGFIVQRMVPEVQEELTSEIVHWLERNLPADYTWPGNFRELEQCVRNLMIHGDYHFKTDNAAKTPASGESSHKANPEITKLVQQISNLELTADELTSAYCRIAYKQTRSFEKAAKLLQLDRRTVRRKSDTTD